jgi:hypothetical protein
MDGEAEATGEFPEQPREGKWLSYDEIGQIRGIGRPSAVKLAKREQWRRTRGNDGTARVFVPPEWLRQGRKRPGDRSREQSTEQIPEIARITSAFEVAIAALNGRAQAAERRADKAEATRDAAEARVREVEADAAEWWGRSRWERVRAAWKGRG